MFSTQMPVPSTTQVRALVDDVRRQFRRRLLQRAAHRFHDGSHRLLDARADLVRIDDQVLRQAAHHVAAADLHRFRIFHELGRPDLDLDFFRRTLANEQAEGLADVAGNRVVNGIAARADGTGDDDAAEGNDGDFARTAADIDDHAARRFLHRQARADGGSHGFLNQVGFAGAGLDGRVHHGTLLHFRDAARHADDDTGAQERMPAQGPVNEILQHGLGDVEISDDAVLHGTDGNDVARRTADHGLGFRADFQHFVRFAVHCHDGRLMDDDAFALAVYQCIRRSQVDAQVMGEIP